MECETKKSESKEVKTGVSVGSGPTSWSYVGGEKLVRPNTLETDMVLQKPVVVPDRDHPTWRAPRRNALSCLLSTIGPTQTNNVYRPGGYCCKYVVFSYAFRVGQHQRKKKMLVVLQQPAWIRPPLLWILTLLVSSGFAFPLALAFAGFTFTIFAFALFAFSIPFAPTHRGSAVGENLELVLFPIGVL